MRDAIDEANEEIKRADHLIFVSLKYTRTVDVFKSVLERLINAFDCLLNGMLKKLLREKKIDSVPGSIKARCELLKERSSDERFADYIRFYLMLRKINKADYTRSMEFRKHVTMTATLDDGKVIEVTIEVIRTYFERTKAFIECVKEMFGEEL